MLCTATKSDCPISTFKSVDNLLKEFGPRSRQENVWRGLNLNCLTLGIILKKNENTFKIKSYCQNLNFKSILISFILCQININIFHLVSQAFIWERSGSVLECLTRDRGAVGLSLTGVTVLCP